MTPVRTACAPSPAIIVRYPTATPGTSVIAPWVPLRPANGTPRSLALIRLRDDSDADEETTMYSTLT
ncbi:hypothetical protein MOX01_25180 [Microbacterium oxydans]|nr:hypothetical protein MOX01_25180 [Microbacterium oxydans]